MAQLQEQSGLSIEAEYAKRLFAVLPLFMSKLPCYNPNSRNAYNIIEENEFRNLRSSTHFEIRFLHLSLSRAEAALGNNAFVGCSDVLKPQLDLLESMLQEHTVPYLTALSVSPQTKTLTYSSLYLDKTTGFLKVLIKLLSGPAWRKA